MVALNDPFAVKGQYPAEQQIEVKKEPSSKAKLIFNIAKNVTLLVGGTFGTLLAINYIGREMQNQGLNLTSWMASQLDNPYCFRVGICTNNPEIMDHTVHFGANLIVAGARLENVSGDLLHKAIAPAYTVYRASGAILAKALDAYTSNIKPLICTERAKVVLQNAQETVASASDSITSIFNRGMESLNDIPVPGNIANPILVSGHS